jgi:hypothetical protein
VSKFVWIGIVSAVVLVGCAGADDGSSGESVGESQDHLLAGRKVPPSEVASVLRAAGFPESAIGKMVCTAKYESSFFERASNHNSNGTTDYGLFQINSVHLREAGCPSTGSGLYVASANARCALTVYRSQGINAWVAYKKHRSECDSYAAPASAGSSSQQGSTGAGADDTSDTSAGGCWSGTLDEMVDANTCVESQYNGVWYQCHDGQWVRGVTGSSGPYGQCSSVHPL